MRDVKLRKGVLETDKEKFMTDGLFRAELNEFFTRKLADYSGAKGCEVVVSGKLRAGLL